MSIKCEKKKLIIDNLRQISIKLNGSIQRDLRGIKKKVTQIMEPFPLNSS
jgi:hypothetical protein